MWTRSGSPCTFLFSFACFSHVAATHRLSLLSPLDLMGIVTPNRLVSDSRKTALGGTPRWLLGTTDSENHYTCHVQFCPLLLLNTCTHVESCWFFLIFLVDFFLNIYMEQFWDYRMNSWEISLPPSTLGLSWAYEPWGGPLHYGSSLGPSLSSLRCSPLCSHYPIHTDPTWPLLSTVASTLTLPIWLLPSPLFCLYCAHL